MRQPGQRWALFPRESIKGERSWLLCKRSPGALRHHVGLLHWCWGLAEAKAAGGNAVVDVQIRSKGLFGLIPLFASQTWEAVGTAAIVPK